MVSSLREAGAIPIGRTDLGDAAGVREANTRKAGIASPAYALIEANARGWTSPLILALFAVSVATLTSFFVVKSRTAGPMLQLHFFRDPTFAAANAVAAIISFGLFGIFIIRLRSATR